VFFGYLDKKFGMSNVVVMLTADHGVAPTPEFAAEQGLDGRRTDAVALMSDLLAKLTERFGPGKYLLAPRIFDGQLFYNHDTLREKQLEPETLSAFVREWALGTGRYQAVFSRGQLLDGRVPGLLGAKVFNGYHAERSGDVVLVAKPFILPVGGRSGTTHGSAYSYDTHVPVLFFGQPFKPGRYADDFRVSDIVPTLCAAMRMNVPSGAIGRPLVRALADQGPGERPVKPVPAKKR
jgi:arylsulfatase A-like enzyme